MATRVSRPTRPPIRTARASSGSLAALTTTPTLSQVAFSPSPATPPPILVVNVSSQQQVRGFTLHRGWNYVPVEALPTAGASLEFPRVDRLSQPLAENGTLQRVWRLDSRTQEWQFYDPDPAFASFNSLQTVNLGANPSVVVLVNVTRTQEFRGQRIYRGWNQIVLR